MESKRSHFVRIAGQVRGPLSVEQLREMGTIEVVTPETDIAPTADGPWVRLATLPICPEVFPPRRAIEFKSAKFDTLNHPEGAAPAMVPEEAIEQSLRIPPSFRGREIVVPPLGLRGTMHGEPLNEVQEMVLDVGRRVAANAPPEVLLPPPSRFPHWRWFAALSVLGSTAIMCIPLLYERQYDQMSVSILGMWTIMFNGLLIGAMMLDRRLGQQLRTNKSKMDALR